VVDNHISRRFERQVNDYYNNDKTKFFGFDTQWRVKSGIGFCECAIISLCDGNSCLPLSRSSSVRVPQSLANFLSHPNYTFVGIGMVSKIM
jgi:hypothetical protein